MADMLIRDIPPEVKRLLAVRAAENGRSQSAEAIAILSAELQPAGKSWVFRLMEAAQEVGGVELEFPEWAPEREFYFEEE